MMKKNFMAQFPSFLEPIDAVFKNFIYWIILNNNAYIELFCLTDKLLIYIAIINSLPAVLKLFSIFYYDYSKTKTNWQLRAELKPSSTIPNFHIP